jgi:hypothetical protein
MADPRAFTIPLPDFRPSRIWTEVGCEAKPYAGVFPPIEKRADGTLIVDRSGAMGVLFDNRDHPNLQALPADAPRAVKRLYRRDFQLFWLRATDAFPAVRAMEAAFDAWAAYGASRSATAGLTALSVSGGR